MQQSIENEKFLFHPDSLLTIRYLQKPVNQIYHFEAHVANKLLPGDKSTNIYLTRKWVNTHFDPTFVRQVIKAGNGQYLHLQNQTDNATQESIELAERFGNEFNNNDFGGKARLYKRFRGGEGTMLIAQLRVKITYKNISSIPFSKKWEITSISKESYLNMKTSKKEVSHWLEIEEGLVMHDNCVGPEQCGFLLTEVHTMRSAELKNTIGEEHQNEDTYKEYCSLIKEFIDMDQEFPGSRKIDIKKIKHKPDDFAKIPQYILGEKQIASIKYDSKRKHFYGRTITSVYQGGKKVITGDELLPQEWVSANLSKQFIQMLMYQPSDKFIYIPVGNAFQGKKYPYSYNKSYPKIVFPQGKLNTCATSSLASCLFELRYEDAAEKLESYGQYYTQNLCPDGLKMQTIIRW
ncbi:MAG: hypothetical protein ACRCXZ_10185, partial [Patescibacteria group bacterium]